MNNNKYEEAIFALNKIEDIIKKNNTVYFFGAGLRAEQFLKMQELGFDLLKRPVAFLVSFLTEKQKKKPFVQDIPIYIYDEIESELAINDVVLVISMDIYHEEIKKKLQDCPCGQIYYLSDYMERVITRRFWHYYCEKTNLNMNILPLMNEYVYQLKKRDADIHMYCVKCEKDAKLKSNINGQSWICQLQCGAAYSKHKLATYTDDTGDNISKFNDYYNELTGLYWIWKNTNHKYSGICHYRRHFETEMVLKYICEEDADVILPMPTMVGPNLETYYLNWGEKIYYDTMLEVLKEKYPEYYLVAIRCVKDVLFIPNNICIAKRSILEDYCDFLFTVVFEVERRLENYQGKKQVRCWLSEHVSTIYFVKHINDYKIYYANLKRYW